VIGRGKLLAALYIIGLMPIWPVCNAVHVERRQCLASGCTLPLLLVCRCQLAKGLQQYREQLLQPVNYQECLSIRHPLATVLVQRPWNLNHLLEGSALAAGLVGVDRLADLADLRRPTYQNCRRRPLRSPVPCLLRCPPGDAIFSHCRCVSSRSPRLFIANSARLFNQGPEQLPLLLLGLSRR